MTTQLSTTHLTRTTSIRGRVAKAPDLHDAVQQLRLATDRLDSSIENSSQNIKPLIDLLHIQTTIIEVLVRKSSIQDNIYIDRHSNHRDSVDAYDRDSSRDICLENRVRMDNATQATVNGLRPQNPTGSIGSPRYKHMMSPKQPVLNHGPQARLPEIRFSGCLARHHEPQTAEIVVVPPSPVICPQLPPLSLRIGVRPQRAVSDTSSVSHSSSVDPSFDSLASDIERALTTASTSPSSLYSPIDYPEDLSATDSFCEPLPWHH